MCLYTSPALICRFPWNVELVDTSLSIKLDLVEDGEKPKELQDEKVPRNSAYRQRFRASRINVRKSTRDQILNESGNVADAKRPRNRKSAPEISAPDPRAWHGLTIFFSFFFTNIYSHVA